MFPPARKSALTKTEEQDLQQLAINQYVDFKDYAKLKSHISNIQPHSAS